MKKSFCCLFALLIILSTAASAIAAGEPPPKDMLKGVFTGVDVSTGKAVFLKDSKGASTHVDASTGKTVFVIDASDKIMVLTLGRSLSADDIPLNKQVMVSLDKHAGEGVIKDVSVMFMEMTPQNAIALIVIGLVGGLLSGFIGSGGAFVLTPAMMSLGVPGAIAVASNMCHKFPKAMVGAYKRYKYGQADIKLGLVMAASAVFGVQIGIKIQKYILNHWGNAGSNLYVSVVFVIVLVVVGAYVFYDAYKLARGGCEFKISKLAQALMKLNIPPMMHFKVANVRISAWITIPVGLCTGMLAATIAVGGFIGVPGLIYVIGASAIVASATELIIAFVMGFWGAIQWGISGLIDIRLTLLILSGSLIGVQLGALGTTYVKDHVIKVVMASVMLIVAVSRGAKIPGYLADVGLSGRLEPHMASMLDSVSFWALVTALAAAGIIITVAMIKGMMQAKAEVTTHLVGEAKSHG